MTTVTLIVHGLMRRKARAGFTWMSVVATFILFSILSAVRYGLIGQIRVSVAERLQTVDRANAGGPMPLSYFKKIVAVPGVTVATYVNELAGYYQDRRNPVQVLTVSNAMFQVFAEAKVPEDQLRRWQTDQQGVIAGSELARRMRWRIGDNIPIRSRVLQANGSTTWHFHLDGIYHANLPDAYQSFFVAHYEYFNESVAAPELRNVVLEYLERAADPRDSVRVSSEIDRLFADSSPQTFTQSEVQSALSAVRQFGNITEMVQYVGIAVFFGLLLIVGNTMTQSVRERMGQFAVMKAIGFDSNRILGLIVGEAVVLVGSGCIVGLILGWRTIALLYPGVGGVLPNFVMTWTSVLSGLALGVAFAAATALVPSRRIFGLQVAEVLRRG